MVEARARDDVQGVTVLDCSGIGMTDLSGDVMGFIRKTNALYGKHFPKRRIGYFSSTLHFYLGPSGDSCALIDPATVAKVNILRGRIKSELLKVIATDDLPKEYGGTSAYALGEAPEHVALLEMLGKPERGEVVQPVPPTPPPKPDALKQKVDSKPKDKTKQTKTDAAPEVNGDTAEHAPPPHSKNPKMLVVIEILPRDRDVSATSLIQLAKIVKSVKAQVCQAGASDKTPSATIPRGQLFNFLQSCTEIWTQMYTASF